jgi:hypothetical protein
METCIVRGLIEKGKANSRWLVSQNGVYYTTIIPNKELPVICDEIQVKKFDEHRSKHLKKEIVSVIVKFQIKRGSKRSKWKVSFKGVEYTCLLSNFLAVKPKETVLIEEGKLKKFK